MSDDFRRIAAREIEEFKAEYRDRYPERDAEKISEEELLREVMNTVGKPGKLGEQIRCVVPVSMLTEGWDANTVTHTLGILAFGTQLLASRSSAALFDAPVGRCDEEGHFYPEYAEVTASFIPRIGRRIRTWIKQCATTNMIVDGWMLGLSTLRNWLNGLCWSTFQAVVLQRTGAGRASKATIRPSDPPWRPHE